MKKGRETEDERTEGKDKAKEKFRCVYVCVFVSDRERERENICPSVYTFFPWCKWQKG